MKRFACLIVWFVAWPTFAQDFEDPIDDTDEAFEESDEGLDDDLDGELFTPSEASSSDVPVQVQIVDPEEDLDGGPREDLAARRVR